MLRDLEARFFKKSYYTVNVHDRPFLVLELLNSILQICLFDRQPYIFDCLSRNVLFLGLDSVKSITMVFPGDVCHFQQNRFQKSMQMFARNWAILESPPEISRMIFATHAAQAPSHWMNRGMTTVLNSMMVLLRRFIAFVISTNV